MVQRTTRQQFDIVTARILAVRDVVARLLAYEAARWPDPFRILEDFSSATDMHIHQFAEPGQVDDSELRFQEEIRMQVDWIVSAARIMQTAKKEY
jgi:hypothetical protein